MLVSHFIINYLKSQNVQAVFGVGGANIEDLYDALFYYGNNIVSVIAKHEFSAVTMADGYNRASGKLAAVFSTSGGGAFNLVPGLAEAFSSRVPLLVIIGQVPSHQQGRGGFQDSSGLAGSIFIEDVFKAVSKYCEEVASSEQIVHALRQAVETALATPQGPSVLIIPKDIQNSRINLPKVKKFTYQTNVEPSSEFIVAQELLDEAIRLILSSEKRVVFICGEAIIRSNSQAIIEEFALLADARVLVTAGGKGTYDNHSDRFSGVIGVMGHPSATEVLDQANTCVLIGTRMSVMSRFGIEEILKKKNIINIHSEESFIEFMKEDCNRWVELRGPVTKLLGELCVRFHFFSPISKEFDALDKQVTPLKYFTAKNVIKKGKVGSSFEELMYALDVNIEPQSNLIVDAGNVGASATHFLKTPRHGRFIIALGMGGMGYSFGAAIGACIANGNRTYVVAGDGSFFMHGSEIHTAVEYGLPITFIIFNNNAHAMCVTREIIYYNAPYSYNRFNKVDIGGSIKAMFPSMPTFSVKDANEFREALIEINRNSKSTPSFICVEIDADEFPPFKPFLDKVGSSFVQLDKTYEEIN